MDWDAVTAVSTAVSAAAIVVGGTVAIYQLREGRRAAQFDATQRMVDRMLDLEFNRALRYVIDELPNRMSDPLYTADFEQARGWDIDPAIHPEMIVLARLEETGIYLRRGLLSGDALLDFTAALILQGWEPLQGAVALMRKSHRNQNVWSNAEYLYRRARAVQ